MARIRVPVAILSHGFGAAMPSYTEVPGSYDPIIPGKVNAFGISYGVSPGDPALVGVTVLADVPDDEVNNGQVDKKQVKAKYPDHPLVKAGLFD